MSRSTLLALAALLGAGCSPKVTTTPAPAPAKPSASAPAWPDELPFRTLAPRPTTPDITAADMMTRLYRLADDSMQGRESGKLGNFKGTAYIAEEFARDGLTPAGEDGGFFQVIGLERGLFDSTLAFRSAAGPIRPWSDIVPLPPLGTAPFRPELNIADAPSVYAGTWGDPAGTPDAAGLKGKVAIFRLPGDGRSLGFWGASEPRAAGAAAVAVVVPDSLMPLIASNFDHAREFLQSDHPPEGPLAAFISASAAARLFGHPVDSLSAGAAGAAVTATAHYAVGPTAYPARNVIALLKGSDPKRNGEYVVISAHNDHIGMGRPADHDSIRAFNRVMRPWGRRRNAPWR